LTPKASADRVGEMRQTPEGEEQLTVYVTAPPDDGKANEAMIRLLAKHFKTAPSRVTLVRGHTNRNKMVRIE
jgi:uncharacterized protein